MNYSAPSVPEWPIALRRYLMISFILHLDHHVRWGHGLPEWVTRPDVSTKARLTRNGGYFA